MDRMTFIEKLDSDREYSRRELYRAVSEGVDGYSYNSFNWNLKGMLSAGMVHRSGRNSYKVGRPEKKDYSPRYSDKSRQIVKFMEDSYPETEYSLFETSMLNEFLNHQIAHNTYFLYVEKELTEFVFRDIKTMNGDAVLFRPRKDDLRKYWKPESVIIIDRISEAPCGKRNRYDTPLEKLFVDLISDGALLFMYSRSEYPDMLRSAGEKYIIDNNRMFRYAGRRGKRQEIMAMMKDGRIES